MLTISLLAALGVWRWATQVLAPANLLTVQAAKRPIGNNSDLYPRWLGARELLLHGRDPYSEQVTRDIQTGFYGRPLDPQNPHDPIEKESFVYPLYMVFLLAPTVKLPFALVAAIFRWLMLAAIALSVPLWMSGVGLRGNWPTTVSVMLLAVGSYPAVEEYFQQNLTALVVVFLAAATAAAARHWMVLSGFLLALATSKPDVSAVAIVWLLGWAAANWKQRSRLVYSFAATLTVLVVAAEVLSPHWIGRFLTAVREYRSYGADPSILRLLLPTWLSSLTAAGLLLALVSLCWKWRHAAAGSREFAWGLAWVVSVTLVILPKAAAYNQLLLLPALLVLGEHHSEIASSGLLARALAKATWVCLVWTWLAACLLAVGLSLLPLDRLQNLALSPLYTLLALPAVLLLATMAVTLQPSNGAPVARE
jgi:hypothetical protein